MKVLHVVASLAPRHGGPTRAALGMVSALRAQGIDAQILSSNDDLGGSLNVPVRVWALNEGVPVLYLPRTPAKQHTLVGFTYTPEFSGWLRKHIRNYDFIHVHTVFSHPANMAMREARLAGIPFAVRPLGQLCRWSMQQRSWVKKLQLALITRRNIDAASFIHVTAPMEAEETAELGFKAPCHILPHGLDMPPLLENARSLLRQKLGIREHEKIILFLSRFHEKKGIELLLKACCGIANFKLVLAGSGDADYEEKLRTLATELGLSSKIHWAGFVEGTEKWQLLQGADLYVLPSYSENFGIAVLEAIACGLPVLISDQVALADEVLKHRLGSVCPLTELHTALPNFLNQTERLIEIKQRARMTAEQHFSWSASAHNLINAYRNAMEKANKTS